jgi:4-aminobutyrate aminotransferase
VDRDREWTSPSYIKVSPLVIAGGKGAMIEDVDGNRFIDFMAGIAVSATGYNHPRVVQAIQDQAGKFLHVCGTDFYFEGFARLAERLATSVPGPSKKRVFLTNSGTEAVDGAIKLARYHTRRSALIAFHGSFHGRSYGGMSLTSSKTKQRKHFGPFVPEIFHVSFANPYRDGGDQAAIEHSMSELRLLFDRQLSPDDVAGIFVEPIQGEGGYIIPPIGFLKALRALCDQHGIMLVADEIQSGVGRTGKMWASEWDGIEPDIICTAKGLGSGMPIGALIAKESVMTWESGSHGSTFGGNPVCIAAALATLDVIEREGLLRNAQEVGDHMLKRMAGWPKKHKIVGDVRGRGLMVGVEIVKDQKTREYGNAERDRIVEQAFERGVLFLGCGPSTVRIAPPLIVTKDEADVAIDVLEESIAIVAKNA